MVMARSNGNRRAGHDDSGTMLTLRPTEWRMANGERQPEGNYVVVIVPS
jgi:hypothetical protein